MTCATCGTAAGAGARFCAVCGSPLAALALVQASPPVVASPQPSPGRAVPAGYGPSPQGGPACPLCFGSLVANRYTIWHALAAVFFFPVGVAAFFAPVRVCAAGHRYGAGVWITGTIKVVLVLGVLACVTAIWLLFDCFHRIEHAFG